jgi:hypothetical protein
MYVSDRSADSICDTALLFLVMKSEYMPSHPTGMDSTSVVPCFADLYMMSGAPAGGDYYRECADGGLVSSRTQEVGVLPDRSEVTVACAAEAQLNPCFPTQPHFLSPSFYDDRSVLQTPSTGSDGLQVYR